MLRIEVGGESVWLLKKGRGYLMSIDDLVLDVDRWSSRQRHAIRWTDRGSCELARLDFGGRVVKLVPKRAKWWVVKYHSAYMWPGHYSFSQKASYKWTNRTAAQTYAKHCRGRVVKLVPKRKG